MPRVFAALASLAILVLTTLPAGAAETTLRITLQLPIESHLGQNLLLFKEEVEKNSGGAIEVQIFDSAKLYTDEGVLQAVGSGQIEMGSAPLTRFVDEIPAVEIFFVPFLFNSENLVRAATNKDSSIRSAIDGAILETGSRVLWWQAYGGTIIVSKDGPLKTPADIKGKKVRVFSKALGKWIEASGGTPVLTSGSDQYQAYQNGLVDIGMTGISSVTSRKLWEVMKWVTVTNNTEIEFVVLINEKFWQGLPDNHKSVIEAAAANADAAARDEMAEIEQNAFRQASLNGMTIYNLTPSEVKAWRASAESVIETYLQKAGPLGKEIYEEAEELWESERRRAAEMK